jgi:hypothetical protein
LKEIIAGTKAPASDQTNVPGLLMVPAAEGTNHPPER